MTRSSPACAISKSRRPSPASANSRSRTRGSIPRTVPSARVVRDPPSYGSRGAEYLLHDLLSQHFIVGYASSAWSVPNSVCTLGCWVDAARGAPSMILPKVRDPRFVTIRRGGTLTDSAHHLLALWAASCAEHVLDLFESAQPRDPRPRQAIEHARAWVRGEVTMTQARAAGGHAMGAARDLRGAARHAAYAAGQAGAVAHVAAHELGAAAYAIKAARSAAPDGQSDAAGRLECRWQRDQLPEAIRELVLDDQRLRNDICWSVFYCKERVGATALP